MREEKGFEGSQGSPPSLGSIAQSKEIACSYIEGETFRYIYQIVEDDEGREKWILITPAMPATESAKRGEPCEPTKALNPLFIEAGSMSPELIKEWQNAPRGQIVIIPPLCPHGLPSISLCGTCIFEDGKDPA